MSPLSATWEVAAWEFRRYFKLKQQVISAIITVVAMVAALGLGRRDSPRAPVDIAVIGPGAAELSELATERLRLRVHSVAEEQDLHAAVGRGELDGLLRISDDYVGSAELVVARRGAWFGELELLLNAHARRVRLAREGVPPEVLQRVLQQADMSLVWHELGRPPIDRGVRVIFIIAISFVLMALFTGVSYLFASITGEKQIRVTEQVISAIPAQSWIDGKILGLAALSIVSVINTALVIGAVLIVMNGGGGFTMPAIAGDPGAIALVLLFALLAFFFWFAFMTAVAALIDDPHTSARSSLLFLPMVSSALAFMAIGNPDGGLVRALSLIPPTSATMLPARLLLSEVPPGETVLALALLVAAVLLLRLAAGRVFRIAMLMYGKEPTWSEVRRWAFTSEPARS
jgi:ABC-2 type transport system permease protein